MFCDVRVCYKQMTGGKKQCIQLPSLSYKRGCSVILNVLECFGIMTDTKAIDVVTFDFKGTRVHCFFSGSTDHQMDYS